MPSMHEGGITDVPAGAPDFGIADDFPKLWEIAQQHDFRERLGGDRDPIGGEVDAALHELWAVRREKADA